MFKLKTFRKDYFNILAYLATVLLFLVFYYALNIWKLVNTVTAKVLALYLTTLFNLHLKTLDSNLIFSVNGKVLTLRLTEECSSLDIGLIFATAALFTEKIDRKSRILGFLELLSFTYLINLARLLATLYFLQISESLFIVMHQIIFRSLMFLVLPGLYLSWYYGRSRHAN